MWFKNLITFRLQHEWTLPGGALEEQLAKHPLLPCSSLSLQSSGWVAPREDGSLVEAQDKHLLFSLGLERRMLPASVVNDVVKEKVDELERSQGFKPGRRRLREIKEAVIAELTPRAFARRQRINAWIDADNRALHVDSSSANNAELVTEALREALDELPIVPLSTDTSPASIMTEWLTAGSVSDTFEISDECELAGDSESHPTVRFMRHALDTAPVRRHLEDGLRVTRLGLIWKDRVSFVVDEKLQLRKIRFLDMDADEETELSAEQRFEADFALMTGSLSKLHAELQSLFKWT